jgi:hypothetical protein
MIDSCFTSSNSLSQAPEALLEKDNLNQYSLIYSAQQTMKLQSGQSLQINREALRK